MGMGFQSISVYNTPPPFQCLISEGAVTSPVFSFKFVPSNSELYLGGTNKDLYTGDFTWVPLSNEVCRDLKGIAPSRARRMLIHTFLARVTGKHLSIVSL